MPPVYIRSITLSAMYQKAPFWLWKISSVACGFSSFKIDYSDYSKSLTSRINEVYVCVFFFQKNIAILKKKHEVHLQLFVLLQSHLLLCYYGFCDVTLYNVSVTLSPTLSK